MSRAGKNSLKPTIDKSSCILFVDKRQASFE